jgi:hypothetical protein
MFPGEGAVPVHRLPQDKVIEAAHPAGPGEDGVGAFPVGAPFEGLQGRGEETGPPALPLRPEKVYDLEKIVARPPVQGKPSIRAGNPRPASGHVMTVQAHGGRVN